MGLYQTYRPQTLKYFVGNEDLKRDLRPFIRGKRTPPKAILFTGPSGAGKTTLARILAKGLGCAECDIQELDTADFRGIDSIRDIRRQMGLAALTGKNRVWILDECFARGTPVSTPQGDRPIETIKVGDQAYSAAGVDTVEHVFKNRVPLERVCIVRTDADRAWMTTKDHLFLAHDGFFPAGLLESFRLRIKPSSMSANTWRRKFALHTLEYDALINEAANPEEFAGLELDGSYDFEYERVHHVYGFQDWRRFGSAYADPLWELIEEEDLARGWVEFYDLEMRRHHSYFANGALVHNCHKLTNDAQNALLKALENPPDHVYFILCTTDPQLLIKTILTRCTQFAVEALSVSELVQVMERACAGEDVEVPEDVLKGIAKNASGSPRQALSMLERLLARKPEDYGDVVATFTSFETQIKDLCQTLIAGKAKWSQVAEMIKNLKEEPETVRRAVLGYMNAILLSGKDAPRAAYILDCFKESYFNTGPAGLTLSCYAAMLQE